MRQNATLCGNGLNFHLTHYHTMTTLDAMEEKSFENIAGKEENAGN